MGAGKQMLKQVCITLGVGLFVSITAFQTQASQAFPNEFAEKARELRAQAKEKNEECMACHGRESVNSEWKTDRGRKLDLHLDMVKYNDSVHRGQSCGSCHQGADGDSFDAVPHEFKDDTVSLSCDNCHDTVFKEINEQLASSHHTKTIVEEFGNEFGCEACHNAHAFKFPSRTEEIAHSINVANEACFSCHNDLTGYEALTDKKLLDQNMAHWFLPEKNKHFAAVRCADCHSAQKGTQTHTITSAEESLRDCTICHSEDTAITSSLYRYGSEQKAFSMLGKGLFDDAALLETNAQSIEGAEFKAVSLTGFMNESLLNDRYLIGATPIKWIDNAFHIALAAILAMLAVHGTLRYLGVREKVELEKTSTVIFPVGVRLWHGANNFVFIVLILTGLSLHYSGFIGFELAHSTHNVFGVVLILMSIAYVIYLLVSGQIRQYLPRKDFVSTAMKQVAFYLTGIYRGQKNPASHDPKKRQNPLQQMTYFGAVFVGLPLLILSGVGLFFSDFIPAEIWGIDGKRLVVMVHVGMSHIMVLFIVAHVYFCTTGATVSEHFKNMLTGRVYKTKPTAGVQQSET